MLGTACGLGVEGSGWIAAPGLVVTNDVSARDVQLPQGTMLDYLREVTFDGERVWFASSDAIVASSLSDKRWASSRAAMPSTPSASIPKLVRRSIR